jgi:hypothetical protein
MSRRLDQRCCIGQHVLRKAAVPLQPAERAGGDVGGRNALACPGLHEERIHALPDAPAGDAVAQRGDLAHAFAAGHAAGSVAIGSQCHLVVAQVHRGGTHLQQHLAGAGPWLVAPLEPQVLEPGTMTDPGAHRHGAPLALRACRPSGG